jgi:hypothetical protein
MIEPEPLRQFDEINLAALDQHVLGLIREYYAADAKDQDRAWDDACEQHAIRVTANIQSQMSTMMEFMSQFLTSTTENNPLPPLEGDANAS